MTRREPLIYIFIRMNRYQFEANPNWRRCRQLPTSSRRWFLRPVVARDKLRLKETFDWRCFRFCVPASNQQARPAYLIAGFDDSIRSDLLRQARRQLETENELVRALAVQLILNQPKPGLLVEPD